MVIESANSKAFSEEGDSGSAVLNDGNQVVGILFSGAGTTSEATPFQAIQNAFKNLSIDVATAQKSGVVQVVPEPSVLRSRTSATAGAQVRPAPSVVFPLWSRLGEVQQEITATAGGQEYAEAIRRHAPEVQKLIDTNRRVAAVWQRSGGPQMIQALLGILQVRDRTIPTEINGKPLSDCVAKMQRVLLRHASPDLATALRKYAPRIAALGGLTYAQLLAGLQTAEGRTGP
jgi:hypothetical protein